MLASIYKSIYNSLNNNAITTYKANIMTISNAVLFKQAHAMTRATIQAGDCYRATFGACLKAIKQDNAKQADKKIVKQAIATALPFTAFFAVMCVIMAVLFAVSYAFANASNANDNSQTVTDNDSVEVMFNDIQATIDESGVQGITIVYTK